MAERKKETKKLLKLLIRSCGELGKNNDETRDICKYVMSQDITSIGVLCDSLQDLTLTAGLKSSIRSRAADQFRKEKDEIENGKRSSFIKDGSGSCDSYINDGADALSVSKKLCEDIQHLGTSDGRSRSQSQSSGESGRSPLVEGARARSPLAGSERDDQESHDLQSDESNIQSFRDGRFGSYEDCRPFLSPKTSPNPVGKGVGKGTLSNGTNNYKHQRTSEAVEDQWIAEASQSHSSSMSSSSHHSSDSSSGRRQREQDIRTKRDMNAANAAMQQESYGEAEKLYRACLRDRKRLYGPDHSLTLNAMNNLANLYFHTERWDEAESLYVTALERYSETLGPSHSYTVRSLVNIAVFYHDRGQIDKAEPLLVQALQLRSKMLGSDHADSLALMNKLCALYTQARAWEQAENMYLECLEIRTRAFGEDHPDTLTSLNNIGSIYHDQGKFDLAEAAFEKCYESYKDTLGEDHSYTLTVMNNLASLYHDQKKDEAAEALYRKCLAGNVDTLGDDHLYSLAALGSLAQFLVDVGKEEEAIEQYERQVEMFKRLCQSDDARAPMKGDSASNPTGLAGLENRRTDQDTDDMLLEAMRALANLYKSTHKYESAESIYLDIAEMQRTSTGPDSLGSLAALNDLAILYRNIREWSKAEPIFKQVLASYRRLHSVREHPDTLACINQLANVLFQQDKLVEAEPLKIESYEIVRDSLGPDHPNTLMALGNLAYFYGKSRKYSRAEEYYSEGIERGTRTLGADHPLIKGFRSFFREFGEHYAKEVEAELSAHIESQRGGQRRRDGWERDAESSRNLLRSRSVGK
jgi:tetratricopeptide (TPR) repeat protein